MKSPILAAIGSTTTTCAYQQLNIPTNQVVGSAGTAMAQIAKPFATGNQSAAE